MFETVDTTLSLIQLSELKTMLCRTLAYQL